METKKIIVKNWDESGKKFDPCSLYNWRLDWLENQILRHRKNGLVYSDEQYQRWYDEEEKVYNNNMRDSVKMKKLQRDTAIIVPTHYHHSKWIRACLESCQKLGYFIVLAYDNPFYSKNLKIEQRMPSVEALYLADYISIKPKTWGSGVGIPHAWNMFFGLKMIQSLGFEYVFNLNGDCILEKPENFHVIREMLGNNDLIACEYIPEKKYCGTMSFLCKTKILMEIWKEYIEKLYFFNIGNAERRMGEWTAKKNAKVVAVENPEDAHFKPIPGADQKGTWRKVLGLRHLHAEHKVRRTLKLEPIEKKYFDFGPGNIFMDGFERNTIMKYWETNDRKFLEAWWAGG